MCTALSFLSRDHYFGRNLDLECSYGEVVAVTPRRFPLPFRRRGVMGRHYAMVGVAHVAQGYPLYYDAVNEKGLGMAGLNFPVSARYRPETPGKDNIAPFELIPWVLSQCARLKEARALLSGLNLAAIPFSGRLPLTPLHWMIAHREGVLVVESMADGLHVRENPVGVLTNEPPFPVQLWNLSNYMGLSGAPAANRFAPALKLAAASRGMGAMGLPGDLSSQSRFVRAAFVRHNSVCGGSEKESVSQFFHILGSVAQQRGCVVLEDGRRELTLYSSCCNTDKGIYYYATYESSALHAVDLRRERLDGGSLSVYPLKQPWRPHLCN